MTYYEFEKKIEALIPGASLEFDNYGQIVIYTGKMYESKMGKIVPFIDGDEDAK